MPNLQKGFVVDIRFTLICDRRRHVQSIMCDAPHVGVKGFEQTKHSWHIAFLLPSTLF